MVNGTSSQVHLALLVFQWTKKLRLSSNTESRIDTLVGMFNDTLVSKLPLFHDQLLFLLYVAF